MTDPDVNLDFDRLLPCLSQLVDPVPCCSECRCWQRGYDDAHAERDAQEAHGVRASATMFAWMAVAIVAALLLVWGR